MRGLVCATKRYRCKKSLVKSAAVMLLLAVMLLSACANPERVYLPVVKDYDIPVIEIDRTTLKAGIVSGPYAVMFDEAIRPLMERLGYSLSLVQYDDYASPNIALAGGMLDMNVFQHCCSLYDFNAEHDVALSPIAFIPTLPMGIYSIHYDRLWDIEEGASVSIPSDPINRARALALLETANFITFAAHDDRRTVTEDNIVENYLGLVFVPLRPENLVQSLTYSELSIIDGRYAINGGLDMMDGLYFENIDMASMNVIAVRTEDMKEQFVMDIIRVVNSSEFVDIIKDRDGNYVNFQKPSRFFDR